MQIEAALFILGLICSVIGLFNLPVYLYDYHKDRKLRSSGTETRGTIFSAETYPNDDTLNSGQYRYYAEFKDEAGITRRVSSRFADGKPDAWLNREVAILYDRDNPDNSRFRDDYSPKREVIEYLIIALVGIILLVVWVFMIGAV